MKIPALIFFLVGVFAARSQTLTITVHDVKNNNGKVGAALYSSEKSFMKTYYKANVVQAKNGDLQIVFENIPGGEYALSVLHDENDNGKMDSNSVGIPKEGYGFSNDAIGAYGPPRFGKAKFVMGKKDLTIAVKMKYF